MIDVHMGPEYHDTDGNCKQFPVESEEINIELPNEQHPVIVSDENQEMGTLATRLKEAREEARNGSGYSQQELADLAKCGQSLIGNLESGNQKTSGKIPRLAAVLGVKALWLAEGIGPKLRTPGTYLPYVFSEQALEAAQIINAMSDPAQKAMLQAIRFTETKNKIEKKASERRKPGPEDVDG